MRIRYYFSWFEEVVMFYEKCGFEIILGPIVNENLSVIDFKMIFQINKI